MTPTRTLGTVLLAAIMALSACTTTINGTARPHTQSTQDSSQPAVCSRAPDPDNCAEFQRTEPAKGEHLFTAWAADEAASSQMLCSALPDQTWQQWLSEGFYRYVNDSSWCELWSADNQIAIKLGLFGASPLREYLARFQSDPGISALTRQVQIAGVPAMTTGLAADSDGVGRDGEQITLAPHGDADKPGVLLIRLELHPPRGRPSNTPVDRNRIGFRDDLAGALLGALYPR
ncbi:hypothetical protein [Saccharothrix stipae]